MPWTEKEGGCAERLVSCGLDRHVYEASPRPANECKVGMARLASAFIGREAEGAS